MATTYNYGSPSGNVLVPVANLQKRTKQLDINAAITSSSGTISTKTAVAIFYADSSGNWRMRANIDIMYASEENLSSAYLIFATGANFSSSPAIQPMAEMVFNASGATQACKMYAQGATNRIYFYTTSTTIKYVRISCDVALAAEPTTYTTAANMEGAPNVAAYIPSASASTAGLVDLAAQTFAGAKTFSSSIVGYCSLPKRFTARMGTDPGTITKDGYRDLLFNNDSNNGCEDPNSNYDTSTGIYTVPETGIYMVSYGLSIIPGGTVPTTCEAGVSVDNGTAMRAHVYMKPTTASKDFYVSNTICLSLTAAQTLRIKLYVAGQDVTINYGAASYTYFSAIKIGTA
jgi:hypothetical protein